MNSCDNCESSIDETAIHDVSLVEPTFEENTHFLEEESAKYKYEKESEESHTRLCGQCLSEYEHYESNGLI